VRPGCGVKRRMTPPPLEGRPGRRTEPYVRCPLPTLLLSGLLSTESPGGYQLFGRGRSRLAGRRPSARAQLPPPCARLIPRAWSGAPPKRVPPRRSLFHRVTRMPNPEDSTEDSTTRSAAASPTHLIGATMLACAARLPSSCAWQESNLRPRAPEARALSPELQARSLQSSPGHGECSLTG
jgi:hypothetical protein